jgi:hypothetical protein
MKMKIPKKRVLKSSLKVYKEKLRKMSIEPIIISRPAIIDMPSGLSVLEKEEFFERLINTNYEIINIYFSPRHNFFYLSLFIIQFNYHSTVHVHKIRP